MTRWKYAGGLLAVALAASGAASGQQTCEQQLQQLEDELQRRLLDGQMQRHLQELIIAARSAPDADCQEVVDEARQELDGLDDAAQTATRPAAGVATDSASDVDEIIGAAVVTADGEDVGEVSGLARARADGSLHALIDVGGFLGLGERTVALPLERFDHESERRLITRMTREELEQLPEYASDEYAPLDEDSRSFR